VLTTAITVSFQSGKSRTRGKERGQRDRRAGRAGYLWGPTDDGWAQHVRSAAVKEAFHGSGKLGCGIPSDVSMADFYRCAAVVQT
jgi:hypothetical protein